MRENLMSGSMRGGWRGSRRTSRLLYWAMVAQFATTEFAAIRHDFGINHLILESPVEAVQELHQPELEQGVEVEVQAWACHHPGEHGEAAGGKDGVHRRIL